MVNKDQTIGGLICIVCIAIAIAYTTALFSLTFLTASPFNGILNLIFGGAIFIFAYLTLLPIIGVLNTTDMEIFRLLFHKIKSVWPIIKLLLFYEAKLLKYTQKLTW